MKKRYRSIGIGLALVALCALISTQKLSAAEDTEEPPSFIQVGKVYKTEFVMHTLTFTVLEVVDEDWIKIRVEKGGKLKKEFGEVFWLNLSTLKAIAEEKPAGLKVKDLQQKQTD